MDQNEKQEIITTSPLPILPRLERVDRLLQFLEEKHRSSVRKSLRAGVPNMEAENNCNVKTLSSAMEEVHHKGTLMERLAMLEKRVLELCLKVDEGNTSTSMTGSSSSRVVEVPQNVGDEYWREQSVVAKAKGKGKGKRRHYRVWLRWFPRGC
ncbi:hypothetical protein PanWU01x14_226870 [Parasponia andersonii]|uniref:Uncharacterized protein n=1 Tax=Parasponia andersonii TaxID=3476 RepID=A0A2P5BMR2_PARAD|nr:hypothetical protein PanWU01x14_226870 [Parasponia andersonii]